MDDAAARVLELAEAQGFALAGIASARPSEHRQTVKDWVADGKHGTMAWLANNLDVRLDPGVLLEGARSVIAVCEPYHAAPPPAKPAEKEAQSAHATRSGQDNPATDGKPSGRPRGKLARYAWGDDYHKVLKKRLHTLADTLRERFADHAFRVTVDTAPALERELAARAGLGWQGKNTMMIHPRHGSYMLLGLVVTTLELATTQELHDQGYKFPGPGDMVPNAEVDHCANCTRCIDACPTDAIAPEGYAMDATRCVSYLTLEHREPIDAPFFSGMGDWIAGCDICQEVCPYNAAGQRNPLPIHERYDPIPRRFDQGLDLVEILAWTAEDRARVFRGSALKRMKLDMVRRNALIAIGNALAQREDTALLDAVRRCTDDESDLVRTTAKQVLEQLNR